jgi:gliding motility-associated-like protein
VKRIKFIIAFTTLLFCFRAASRAQSVTTGQITGGISSCSGTASASPNIISFTFSGSKLEGPVTVTAPANFEVSLAAGAGYANTLQVTPVNGTANNTTVYVRSSAVAPTGVLSGNITLASPGAPIQTVAVTGSVKALATVNAVNDVTTGNGISVQNIHFTGTGNYYKWVNDNPAIGIPASGTGDIAPFIAINTGSKPVTATITVTPYFAGSVYVGNDVYSDVTVINTITQKVVTHIKVGLAPESVTVRSDGSLVYFGNMDSGTISVINTQSNTVVNTIPADISPWGLCLSPDGSKLYVAGAYGQILVLDAYTYKTIAAVQVGIGAQGIAASPDGKYIYIAGGNLTQSFVYVLATVSNSIIASIPVTAGPNGMVVTPDNSQVYVANYWNSSVSAINTATNTVMAVISVGYNPTGATITPDGKYVYVAVENNNSVAVINTATQSLERQIQVGQQPFGVSVSPDGATLYAVNAYSCNVSVIDVATQMQTDSIPLEGYMQGPVSKGNFVTAGMCSGAPVTFTITVLPTLPPVITAESAPGPVNTTYGTPSAAASFNISATNLKSTVLVSPPPGFEASSDGITYAPSVTIGQGYGFGTTPVYIRLPATTPVGSYSGNIVLTSTGAQTVNVLMPVSQVNPAPLTITADNKIKIYLSANPPLTASYKGFVNNETTAVFTSFPVLATTAITTSPIGQYPITVSGAADSNYAITYVPGVLKVVRTLAIPNAFTPNGDGINDTWNIDALGAYANCSVQVFTRWGLKVYFSTGYSIPWDGTFKGSRLPTGTYYYLIDLKNGTSPFSGWVAIIR